MLASKPFTVHVDIFNATFDSRGARMVKLGTYALCAASVSSRSALLRNTATAVAQRRKRNSNSRTRARCGAAASLFKSTRRRARCAARGSAELEGAHRRGRRISRRSSRPDRRAHPRSCTRTLYGHVASRAIRAPCFLTSFSSSTSSVTFANEACGSRRPQRSVVWILDDRGDQDLHLVGLGFGRSIARRSNVARSSALVFDHATASARLRSRPNARSRATRRPARS